jgi:signal peptidase I
MKAHPLLKKFWSEWLRPFLVVAAIVLPIKSSLGDINFVPTGSMKPTILEGDVVAVNKLAYDLKVPFTLVRLAQGSDPARGDVVVCFSPADGIRLVKRVVGVPGDTIELRQGTLLINGAPAEYGPLPEGALRYVTAEDRDHAVFADETVEGRSHAVMAYPRAFSSTRFQEPVTLREGEYFLMGDNRDNSQDSRHFGVVRREQIVGRAGAEIVSFDKPGHWLPRVGRFFSGLK